MDDLSEKFKRFREEHARLHDPALVRGAVELVPVELSEVISLAVGERKKKKKRHGPRAGWAPAQLETLAAPAEPPEGDRLLPAEFVQQLPSQARGRAARAVPQSGVKAETPQGEPRMEIEPQSVRLHRSLFEEQAFTVDAPGAQQVELIWFERPQAAGETTSPWDTPRGNALPADTQPELQRVVMDHQQSDRFAVQIGLADGNYLVAFAVDGRTRPPQHLARRIVLHRKGIFAPLQLTRQQQTFVLTNRGNSDERVLLETEAPWLTLDRSFIDLLSHESGKVSVRFDTSRMKPGPNEGLLHLKVLRGDEAIAAGVVQIAVELEVAGAVGRFSFTPSSFGEVAQGLDEVHLQVEVNACGRGPLNGMISLPQSGELVDFRLAADGEETSRFTHTFSIKSAHLALPQPHTAEASLKVMILTDSFLANHRLCRFEIPYRLIYLKKSLPALSFGTIRTGATKTMRLQVQRSDAGDIELAVALPSGAERFLEAYPARADAYIFRLDASQLPPGAKVEETIELIDRTSGLRDHIKVLAAITQSVDESAHAVANLATP
jgi:hypothetical protein